MRKIGVIPWPDLTEIGTEFVSVVDLLVEIKACKTSWGRGRMEARSEYCQVCKGFFRVKGLSGHKPSV